MKHMIKNARLSYPSVFKASAYGDADPKFSAQFLLDEGSKEHKALEAAIKKVAKEEFGDQATAVLKKQNDNSMRRIIKLGNDKLNDEGEVASGYADMAYIKASNKTKPKTFGRGRQEITEQDGLLYGGSIVNASIDIWAQNNNYGKFINVKLLGLQHWEDGEAFGGAGATASADDFEVGEEEDEWE